MKSGLNHYIIILFLFFNPDSQSGAQILSDTSSLNLINNGLDQIYSLKFDEAQNIFSEIVIPGEEHPVIYLLRGLTVYWQNYPLLPNTGAMNLFEADMRRCIELCEMKPYSEDYEVEALLSNVCARGMLLVFYADNHMNWNVIPLASGTYKYIMRSFDFSKICPDLYYFTGIYNYYRDAYPTWHPVYKPVAALFPPGDLATGLRELNICAQKSILLRAEASSILSWIYTNYENNYETAITYTSLLTDRYPENPFFKGLHIKNLLLLREYDEAEKYLELSRDDSINDYYRTQVKVFRAIIQEKKYMNQDLAADLYQIALSELIPFGNYGNEFSAYCYFGLSRISDARGDRAGKKMYHRKAMSLASFKKINFD